MSRQPETTEKIPPLSRRAAIRDAFRRGAVFKVGLALLIADLWLLGSASNARTFTIPGVLANFTHGWHPRHFVAALVQSSDGTSFAVLSSSDEFVKFFPTYDYSGSPAIAMILPVEHSKGLFAPWEHTQGVTWAFRAAPGLGYETAAAQLKFANLVADAFDKDAWGPFWSAPLRSGVLETTRHYPLGVLHDCFVLLTVGSAFTSLVLWLPNRRRFTRESLIASGICPGCRYAAGKLPRCPECGEDLQ